jgi:hypothetical protein
LTIDIAVLDLRVNFWLPDWIARGTLIPAFLSAILEIPILVVHFSAIDPENLFPNEIAISSTGGSLMTLIAVLCVVVGFFAKEPGRAIRILTVSQVISFSLAAIPIFVYPDIAQGLLARVYCIGPGCQIYLDHLFAGIVAYFAGFVIVALLLGFALGGIAGILGELVFERADHSC